MPYFQVLPILSTFAPFSTGVPSEIVLTLCAILSIIPEVVCCWFHQESFHLVKFLLIPSIFSRNAAQIISFLFLPYLVLTRVLCPFAQVLFCLIKSCIPSQPECYPDRFLPFLFLNGVLWTLFSSVVSFLPICSTPQGSWFHSLVKEAT